MEGHPDIGKYFRISGCLEHFIDKLNEDIFPCEEINCIFIVNGLGVVFLEGFYALAIWKHVLTEFNKMLFAFLPVGGEWEVFLIHELFVDDVLEWLMLNGHKVNDFMVVSELVYLWCALVNGGLDSFLYQIELLVIGFREFKFNGFDAFRHLI